MGDYVDRGHNSVETLIFLLVLKALHPDRVRIWTSERGAKRGRRTKRGYRVKRGHRVKRLNRAKRGHRAKRGCVVET